MPIQRGEIFFVKLDPVQGREQSGTRPALVISANWLNAQPLVVTVVIGTKSASITKEYSSNVPVSPSESGLPIETIFICFQLRSSDARRFPTQPAGKLSADALARVEAALRRCLKL
jgi:mRNA interferase MazF